MKIPITRVVFDEHEWQLIQAPLETGWVVQGPYVKPFEEKFARFTGAQFAVATTSCTTALHLALAALGVGPGDEVIVPAFTWVSTANVAVFQGARPVFCDIDLDTFNLDPQQLEAKITPRTKVIIPVHLFGLAAEQHGHNYRLEVTVRGEPDAKSGMVINLTELKAILEREVMSRFDHKDLNADTEFFKDVPPTPENLASVIHEVIAAALPAGMFDRLRLYQDANLYVEVVA
ncbi:MAG: aminotransferase class I/II-fold pyridoxal phosphate-dependent enzyme [Bacteroidetes bacterium]|nr:aminotransferase class I/II-fold pyridoxal phosphate-dependent enzyme [Bacteroidota bacterium]